MGRLGLRPNERYQVSEASHPILGGGWGWLGGWQLGLGQGSTLRTPLHHTRRTYKEETEALSSTEIKDQRGRGLAMD